MRKIDDIIPPSRRREADMPSGTSRMPSTRSRQRPSFPYKTLFAVVLVVTASFGVLAYFSTAKVDVTPNTVSAAVQSSFTATKSTGDLPYEVITAQKIASQTVKGSGTKTVNTSASGYITIYNAQTKSQKLIANTRFATTAGLIFRIHEAVTVSGGGSSKPGSLKVRVYADQPGDSYNVAPTSFTIPGFAGTPQASLVYARSTEAMTGGASGTIPVVDESAESEARNALITALAPDLTTSLEAQIPSGYLLVPGSATTTYEALAPSPSSTTGMVEVKEQGTITAIVFPNATLAGKIAASIAGLDYQNEPLTLGSTDGLKLVPTSPIDPSADSFAFTLAGTASLVYTVDPTRIAAAVAGKTRSAAEVALTNYPEVKRAFITLRPFWRKTFPQDPSTITVTVQNP